MKKIKYLFLFFAQVLFSQTNSFDNTIMTTLSTPDVYTFEKYSLNKANYNVGKVDVSLPIYTIKSGGIEYPINLVYNTGGIKVDQIASDVGLGFSITSTIITRNINGGNDFDNTGNLVLQNDYNSYSQDDKNIDAQMSNEWNRVGFFLKNQNPNNIITETSGLYALDFLPDTYHFYTNGFATNFFFTDINTPVETNPQGTRIETVIGKTRFDTRRGHFRVTGYYNNIPTYEWLQRFTPLTTDFTTIMITNSEGIKYTFSDCDYSLTQDDPKPQVSAWHISKIEDLKTGKKIDFIYDNTDSNPNYVSDTYPGIDLKLAQRTFGYSMKYSDQGERVDNSLIVSTTKIDVVKKRLKKIIFDQGEVHFNYNNLGVIDKVPFIRDDLYNGDCLTQVYIKNKDLETVKSYNFDYGYFESNFNYGEYNPDQGQYSSYRYKRLKLLNFGEIGQPKHKFFYEENHKLPPINSYSMDFLGYFNNSPDKNMLSLTEHPNARLYYYPNNFEKSLLPYNVSAMNPIVFPGYFDREANEYSKTWSLNKIEFPTGGSSEYVYESNKFQEFGQEVRGGGIRIAQQRINDNNGRIRTIDYTYVTENNTTSGSMASTPFFGFPGISGGTIDVNYPNNGEENATVTFSNNINDFDNWVLFDRSNLNADITSGSYVTYSRVIEKEIGNGRKEFNFTSNDMPGFKNFIYRVPPEMFSPQYPRIYDGELIYIFRTTIDPDTGEEIYHYVPRLDNNKINNMIANSAIYSDVFTDKSYKRGKLLEEKVFDESNNLIKEVKVNYFDFLTNTHTFHYGFLEPSDEYMLQCIDICGIGFSDYATVYRSYCDTQSCMYALMVAKKDILVSSFLPINKEISTYDSAGNRIIENQNFTYNAKGFLKSKEIAVNNNAIIRDLYFYPEDPEMANELSRENLIAVNAIGTRLKTETFRDSEKISEKKVQYAMDPNY